LNAPDLETFLSDDDFKAIASLDESQLSGNNSSEWFRDAMYNPELFEGDIKNEVSSKKVNQLFL
jgi:hypothetical protein